jgi:hypothetical protein
MSTFASEVIDSSVSDFGQCCIALDQSDNPHIAYANKNGRPRLASRNAGSWSQEELFGAENIGDSEHDRICLEIDSGGNPHIAYRGVTTGFLLYGVKRDNTWIFTPVPTNLFLFEPGGVTSYDFRLFHSRSIPELRDTPHFVYTDSSTDKVGYTRNRIDSKGRLKLQPISAGTVGETERINSWVSIAYDALGETFRMAYLQVQADLSVLGTKVILNPSPSFDDPPEGVFSRRLDLAVGNFLVNRPTSTACNGHFCVSYYDATNSQLIALFFDFSSSDPFKKVLANIDFPVVPSVACNPFGKYRIAFGDGSKLNLASQNRIGQWDVNVVDSEGGDMPSIVYDDSGKGHIAYTLKNTLKYVSWIEQPPA